MANIIIITGPSGVGKGTIEKELFKDLSLNLTFSVSATTRPKRENEANGVHYYFIDKKTFEKFIDENKFIEYSQHFDNYYGTLYEEIETKLKQNKNVLIEVETNGALNIINKAKEFNKEENLISIFISPPSIKELKRRIIQRKTEDKKDIRKRIKKAKKEIKLKYYFKHNIKNDNINYAIEKIKSIIRNG